MKKYAKVIVFLLAVIIMNLPLSFFDGTSSALASSGGFYKYILTAGVGTTDQSEKSSSSFDAMSLLTGSAKMILTSCIPAMNATDEVPVDESPQKPDTQTQVVTDKASVPVDTKFDVNMTKKELLNTQYHNGNPTVLIYHTHTTESYMVDSSSTVYRSTDPTIGVLAVGGIVSRILYEEYGIEVLHITTVFDNPYDTAYDKSLAALQEAVAKYPSIKYVFDIHRDGLSPSDEHTAIYKVNINGTGAAKIMMVMGTKSAFSDQGIAFSDKLKFAMDVNYPGLTRSTLKRPYNYNQQVCPYSVLLEVGSNLSTPDEAKASGVYLGRAIGTVIKNE